mgnify:CR=1 FL=1
MEAEVVGFKNGRVLLMPLESIQGLGPGCKILSMGHKAGIGVGKWLLVRVINGLGNPIDHKGKEKFCEVTKIIVDNRINLIYPFIHHNGCT